MAPRCMVEVSPGTAACPVCKEIRPKIIPKAAVIPLEYEFDLPF